MSKLTYINIAGEKCHCGCTLYEECGMECSLYRKIIGKQTNADRIRSMTDEELAEWLVAIINHAESDNCGKSCPLYSYCIESNGWMLDWLKAPADKEGE